MEFYLAKENSTTICQSRNAEFAGSVSIKRDKLIPSDIKNAGSAVETTDEQFIQLQECIGLLKESVIGKYQICDGCGHSEEIRIDPWPSVRD